MKAVSLAAISVLFGAVSAQLPVRSTPNWSGLNLDNVGTITQVSASFEPATLNLTNIPSTAAVTGQAAIGIDNQQDCGAFFIAGIQWDYSADLGLKYRAFAQWGNATPVFFDIGEIKNTDVIDVQVESTSKNSANFSILNARTDIAYASNFTDQTGDLCHESAVWVVIDPSQIGADNGPPYDDFADFEEVDFVYPQYTAQGQDYSHAVTQTQGVILNMERDGDRLATGEVRSVPNDTNTVTIVYGDAETY